MEDCPFRSSFSPYVLGFWDSTFHFLSSLFFPDSQHLCVYVINIFKLFHGKVKKRKRSLSPCPLIASLMSTPCIIHCQPCFDLPILSKIYGHLLPNTYGKVENCFTTHSPCIPFPIFFALVRY